jgi:hypothetical protein
MMAPLITYCGLYRTEALLFVVPQRVAWDGMAMKDISMYCRMALPRNERIPCGLPFVVH